MNNNVQQIMNNKINPQLGSNLLNDNKTYCNGNNFAQKGMKNLEGYDVVGCRYDLKFSSQNTTINGPPLASCNIYDVNKMRTTGTLWYPLNG